MLPAPASGIDGHGGRPLTVLVLRSTLVAIGIVVVAAWGLRGPSAALDLGPGDATAPTGVTVVDLAGVVQRVTSAPGITSDGVHPGDRPDTVEIGWTVGSCRPETTLTVVVSGDGFRIEERTAPCSGLGVGIARAVTLELDRPVDAATVQLVHWDGTDLLS